MFNNSSLTPLDLSVSQKMSNFAQMTKGRIILFPSLLAAVPPADVLPAHNIELISSVQYFVVEELRTARRFLKACNRAINIDALHFEVLNEHTAPEQIEAMLAPALQGHDIGIVSEAGCPAVADPGADLVALAHRHGIEVMPLVGPSSILLALMASGFNGQSFTFAGYLPVDAARRADKLHAMCAAARKGTTQIFIETPYRNNRLIAELARTLPADMLMCVAADITGPAQSIVTMPARKWQNSPQNYDKRPAIFLIHRS